MDGFFEALAARRCIRRASGRDGPDIIDAHFVQPDGIAAWLLGRWLRVPYTITLRGQLAWLARKRARHWLAVRAMRSAATVFSVSESLRQGALRLGQAPEHVRVMANGVNLSKFFPEDRPAARARLGLDTAGPILISVGGLTERKGFHRVIEVLPGLLEEFPRLKLLIAGGATPEGDWGPRLREQVRRLGLQDHVRFLGALAPDALRRAYSAADVFVLATRMEGWANVFLEANACGLPVVATDVGGNSEVVSSREIGIVVPFGDADALLGALRESLAREWDRRRIRQYAVSNAWETRIPILVKALHEAAGIQPPAVKNAGAS